MVGFINNTKTNQNFKIIHFSNKGQDEEKWMKDYFQLSKSDELPKRINFLLHCTLFNVYYIEIFGYDYIDAIS